MYTYLYRISKYLKVIDNAFFSVTGESWYGHTPLSSAQHKPVPPACLDAELWLGPWAHAPPLSQHTSYSSSSMLTRGTDAKLLW